TSPNASRLSLPDRTSARHKAAEPIAIELIRSDSSYKISQRHPHLLRRAEQTILRGLFCRAQNLSDLSQTQALIVPQLKHNALARCQIPEPFLDPPPQLSAQQMPLRIAMSPIFRKRIQPVAFSIGRRHHPRLLLAYFALAHLIQAQVGHDAVQPRMKAT